MNHNDFVTPTVRGITPVVANTNRPASVTAQSQLIDQHRKLNKQITDLLSHQTTFHRFIQVQLRKAFPELDSIDPNSIHVKTYGQKPGAERILTSTQTLSQALFDKIMEVNLNALTGSPDKEVEAAFYVDAPDGGAQRKLEPHCSLLTIAQNIATRLPIALSSYWKKPPSGTGSQAPRQEQLLALHRQMLSTEAALRVEDGTLSHPGKQLIDAAFQYPTLAAREAAFASGSRPGVYPIRIDDNTPNGALLAGCFLITNKDGSSAEAPYSATDIRNIGLDAPNGPVVLYTPCDGFEEFASPADAREALLRRINGDEEKANVLLKSLPLSVQHSRNPQWGDDLMLGFAPVSGDVVAQALPLLLKRQADEVKETLQFAFTAEPGKYGTGNLLAPAIATGINDAADLSLQFDGSNAMLARNEKLMEQRQPQWLKELTPEQEARYRELEQAEQTSFSRLQPLLEKLPSLGDFAKKLLLQALKDKLQKRYPKDDVDPDKLMVRVTTEKSINLRQIVLPRIPLPPTSEMISLTDLALRNTLAWDSGVSLLSTKTTWEAHLVGADGKRVTLDTQWLEELIKPADVGGKYLRLLGEKLDPSATSGEAAALRNAWKHNQQARLAKDAFLTSLDPDAYLNKQKIAEQWINATIAHADPTTWPIVNGSSIISHRVARDGKPVQGMLVIKPVDHPSLVLYSPDAPDGRPFREIVGQGQLDTLLAKPEWQTYMDQRVSPADKYSIHDKLFIHPVNMILKQLAVDHERGIALKPIKGSIGEHLYAQNVALMAAKAGAQFITSTEVAAQSATNQLIFAGEVAMLVLDLIPVTKGLAAVSRLSKAALKALRAPGRSLPKLLTQPGQWGAVYSDFSMVAAGLPLLRRTPLRPVFRAPARTPQQRLPIAAGKAIGPNRPVSPAPSTSVSAGRPSSLPLSNPARSPQPLNRGNLVAHALDNQLRAGKPLNAIGPQQVGKNGLIRYTDNSGASSTFNSGSGQSTPSGQKPHPVLVNTKARDLNAEKHLAGAALNPRAPRAELVPITKPEDLNVVSKPNTVSKFVFTQDKQLIVGNIDKDAPPKWLSHPAIAEIGAGSGQSGQVVSAGYIRKDIMGKIHLSNVSGHYLPKQNDLKPAQEFLKNLGVDSTKSMLPMP
ncbi:dermonecrotic toxin domain-containing protein [Pseudomonas sp. 32A]|uniref:dermonecrotic toxin domain-containing protein n=1 Tax=Pseudomonas sp. 32A TaxID=651185 RepID=UPI0040454DB9